MQYKRSYAGEIVGIILITILQSLLYGQTRLLPLVQVTLKILK